jgi:dienelactone hydrolase
MMPRLRQVLLMLAFLVLASPALAQDVSMVPVRVDGESVRLAMRIYKPAGAGPAPTLVFNHGSTGRGNDPSIMVRPIDFPPLAQFFVERGWAVVMPARRGRGGSEGLYDEGFATDRSAGYSCDPAFSIPGADRGLQDINAAMTAILAMPFVDRDRVVIGGQSRGGILSVAYAGQHPTQIKGVINFVGGGGRPLRQRQPHQSGTLHTRVALSGGDAVALRRPRLLLSAVAQPRELRSVPGRRRQGDVPRLHASAWREWPQDFRMPRAVAVPGGGLSHAPGPRPSAMIFSSTPE